MAKTNLVKSVEGFNEKQILAFAQHTVSIGVELNDTGLMAVDGKKVIKAGTPIGGATSALEDETAVLQANPDATAVQGVLLHDVDVTNGDNNGTMLIWGFVNEYRLDEDVVISEDVKEALGGKVTFLKRNDMR